MLVELFGDCYNEEEKGRLVDDLLDMTVLPSTNEKGVIFNKERMRERYDILPASRSNKLWVGN